MKKLAKFVVCAVAVGLLPLALTACSVEASAAIDGNDLPPITHKHTWSDPADTKDADGNECQICLCLENPSHIKYIYHEAPSESGGEVLPHSHQWSEPELTTDDDGEECQYSYCTTNNNHVKYVYAHQWEPTGELTKIGDVWYDVYRCTLTGHDHLECRVHDGEVPETPETPPTTPDPIPVPSKLTNDYLLAYHWVTDDNSWTLVFSITPRGDFLLATFSDQAGHVCRASWNIPTDNTVKFYNPEKDAALELQLSNSYRLTLNTTTGALSGEFFGANRTLTPVRPGN